MGLTGDISISICMGAVREEDIREIALFCGGVLCVRGVKGCVCVCGYIPSLLQAQLVEHLQKRQHVSRLLVKQRKQKA